LPIPFVFPWLLLIIVFGSSIVFAVLASLRYSSLSLSFPFTVGSPIVRVVKDPSVSLMRMVS
jgi:hypothetical protein